MSGNDLCDLLLVAPRALQVRRGGQMSQLAIAPRERAVGHASHKVLYEHVLTALRRPWIRLDSQQILVDQVGERRLNGVAGLCRDRTQSRSGERLAQHCRILEKLSLGRAETVQASGYECVEGLRNFEGLQGTLHTVRSVALDEQTPVEEHAHGFNRVQRNPRGTLADAR